jgi:hypothetical protein
MSTTTAPDAWRAISPVSRTTVLAPLERLGDFVEDAHVLSSFSLVGSEETGPNTMPFQ